MKSETISLCGESFALHTVPNLVVGSGAAGFQAALRLHQLEQEVILVTEEVQFGTSRNTGSDKQTYYKLNLSGDKADSPQDMANDLFAGGCVDGDNALCEAALSARCFYQLLEFGVPFPVNQYGEPVGYKTDHDPRARATSCGPLTSKQMTETLEQQVKRACIPIFNHHLAVAIVKDNSGVRGLLALNTSEPDYPQFTLFCCTNIVWATGGPAGIYGRSVYPACHTGGTGPALEAGALAQNLTEWQYGLASLNPRWNVSGTYMQVLPRLYSVDDTGTEHEFLLEQMEYGKALSLLFQKGYQWPFSVERAKEGSSLIDFMVYEQTAVKGRKVFLDYRQNPGRQNQVDYQSLTTEAREYLQKAGALFGTPLDRLLHMNTPAYELYLSKGVDLKKHPLEIALCAQHHNGGLAVDSWWQTCLPGLFAVGECAGTHGVRRPGGSALNAGQVGALRAAQFIAARRCFQPDTATFLSIAQSTVVCQMERCKRVLNSKNAHHPASLTKTLRQSMDTAAGAIRNKEAMVQALSNVNALLDNFDKTVFISSRRELTSLYRLLDLCLCQKAVLCAMLDYLSHGGGSRGSALYQSLGQSVALDRGAHETEVQLCSLSHGCSWRPVRPLPAGGGFFETVWREYRENQGVVVP